MGQSPEGSSVVSSASNNGVEFHQGKIFFNDDRLDKSNVVTTSPQKLSEPNSVLMSVRAPVGPVVIVDRIICIGRGLANIVPLCDMSDKFLLYLLRGFQKDFLLKATGTTFIAITMENLKNQIIPLPPLAEQKRIVERLETLFHEIAAL